MGTEDILGTLRETMMDVFDLDGLDLQPSTTADDIEEWDSLSHIRLIVAIERQFGIRFNNSEIGGLEDVGELVAKIQEKL